MSEIESAVQSYRRQIDAAEKDVLLRMARLWVPVHAEMRKRVSDLTEALARDEAEGKPVWIGYIHSLERYKSMMRQAEAEIARYNKQARGIIAAEMESAAGVGEEQARELLTLSFPDTPASELWTRVDRQAAMDAAAVTAQGAPLEKLFQKSFPDAKAAMESALVTGIGGGLGWKWIAGQMLKAADIPFSRAERIARTETNRALRNAAFQQYQASPVFTGYRRMCYPPTACLACLALDGEYFPMSEGVLSDHPNGKCSMVPWSDPNKPPDWQTGRQWLMEQTEEDQRRIMGAGRFELWKQGADLRGMVYLKENPIWGGQPAVKTPEQIRMNSLMGSRPMASGLRRERYHILTEEEISNLKQDITAIQADESVFHFNEGYLTGYNDDDDVITVRGEVLPDLTSRDPRDRMSSRAVLAHEYYGHRAYRGTKLTRGAWNDEFRASYMAAKNAPGLSDMDRYYLIQDAMSRAGEFGVVIKPNKFMSQILYGGFYE